MTDPSPKARNGSVIPAGILVIAAALRLRGVDFGLPALNDPDEPLFMMSALDMLRNGTLNPGWFGHPGTVTLYCLALISAGVGAIGIATGRFDGGEGFASAIYADPGIVFLPARIFIAACGVACVYLTYRLGKRLADERLGLVAAAFLAVNAVHIEYSRIIRTDVQASIFMLLATLCTIAIARDGRRRDYILAGLCVGLAAATKWPAALIVAAPICAALMRARARPAELQRLALCGIAAVATLIVVSPYLLLDWQTALRDIAGEARPHHPGAIGSGFLANLAWYATGPVLISMGGGGLALAAAGMAWSSLRERIWAIAILPGAGAFLVAICAQALLWERWIVPLLPFLALWAAWALCGLLDLVAPRTGRLTVVALPLLVMVPMIRATQVEAVERTHDTRQIASAWILAHAPPDAAILVEDAAIDLLQHDRKLLFPLGSAGCLDAEGLLTGRIRYAQVEEARGKAPVVDLGHVAQARLQSCRAPYAVLTHYDRYLADPDIFAEELARYRAIMRGAKTVMAIRPVPGRTSGPVVHVLELAATSPS